MDCLRVRIRPVLYIDLNHRHFYGLGTVMAALRVIAVYIEETVAVW